MWGLIIRPPNEVIKSEKKELKQSCRKLQTLEVQMELPEFQQFPMMRPDWSDFVGLNGCSQSETDNVELKLKLRDYFPPRKLPQDWTKKPFFAVLELSKGLVGNFCDFQLLSVTLSNFIFFLKFILQNSNINCRSALNERWWAPFKRHFYNIITFITTP